MKCSLVLSEIKEVSTFEDNLFAFNHFDEHLKSKLRFLLNDKFEMKVHQRSSRKYRDRNNEGEA